MRVPINAGRMPQIVTTMHIILDAMILVLDEHKIKIFGKNVQVNGWHDRPKWIKTF